MTDDIGADNVLIHLDAYHVNIEEDGFSSAVVAQVLSNDLAVWRNLWDDGADLARHAHHFITEQLFLNRAAA